MSGWRWEDGTEIGVGVLPGRKHKALYVVRENVLRALAYFRDDECATEAEELLGRLARGKETMP